MRDGDDLRGGLVVAAAADLEQRERARLAGGPLRLAAAISIGWYLASTTLSASLMISSVPKNRVSRRY